MAYIARYMEAGYNLTKSEVGTYETIKELYRQQKYMFDNKTHTVQGELSA